MFWGYCINDLRGTYGFGRMALMPAASMIYLNEYISPAETVIDLKQSFNRKY